MRPKGRLSRKAFAGWVALGWDDNRGSLGDRHWLRAPHYLVWVLIPRVIDLEFKVENIFPSVSILVVVVGVLLCSPGWPLTHRSHGLSSGVLRLWAWAPCLAKFPSSTKNVMVFLFHSALWYSLRGMLLTVHLFYGSLLVGNGCLRVIFLKQTIIFVTILYI